MLFYFAAKVPNYNLNFSIKYNGEYSIEMNNTNADLFKNYSAATEQLVSC
jgi:hypothetical protein